MSSAGSAQRKSCSWHPYEATVETDASNDEVDAAYRTKYRRYADSIIDSITSPEARAATLRLVPRS